MYNMTSIVGGTSNPVQIYGEAIKYNIALTPSTIMAVGFVMLGYFLKQHSIKHIIICSALGFMLLIPINVPAIVSYVVVSVKESEEVDYRCYLGIMIFVMLYYVVIKTAGLQTVL